MKRKYYMLSSSEEENWSCVKKHRETILFEKMKKDFFFNLKRRKRNIRMGWVDESTIADVDKMETPEAPYRI